MICHVNTLSEVLNMMSEKIRIRLIKKGYTLKQLALQLGISQSNLSNKLSRDNFCEKELQQIAAILGYELEMNFIDKNG